MKLGQVVQAQNRLGPQSVLLRSCIPLSKKYRQFSVFTLFLWFFMIFCLWRSVGTLQSRCASLRDSSFNTSESDPPSGGSIKNQKKREKRETNSKSFLAKFDFSIIFWFYAGLFWQSSRLLFSDLWRTPLPARGGGANSDGLKERSLRAIQCSWTYF